MKDIALRIKKNYEEDKCYPNDGMVSKFAIYASYKIEELENRIKELENILTVENNKQF